MPYLKLLLRAVNQDTNINRVYEIYLDKGLFNSWMVITAYGRYGPSKGHHRTYSFETLQQAQAFIHKTLNKRFSSLNRIGCKYQVVHNEGHLENT